MTIMAKGQQQLGEAGNNVILFSLSLGNILSHFTDHKDSSMSTCLTAIQSIDTDQYNADPIIQRTIIDQ